MNTKAMTAAVLALLLGAREARGATLEGLGRELAAAAKAAGLRRVAVAGLEPASGREDGGGSPYDERLTAAMVKAGAVKVVERDQVSKLMKEKALSRSGAAEERKTPSARLSAADAVVVGRWFRHPYGVRVTARLVSPDDGVILAAGEATIIEEDAPAAAPAAAPGHPALPELVFETPAGGSSPVDPLGLPRDAPVSVGCADAGAKADRLTEEVLELKARYWAGRERKSRRGTLAGDPAAGVSDPGVRERLLARVRYWRTERRVPALSPEELRRFVRLDGEAFTLRAECGAGTYVANNR